jgi:hypothetical protein
MRRFTSPQFHIAYAETLRRRIERPDFIGQTGCGAIFLLQKIGYFNKLQA